MQYIHILFLYVVLSVAYHVGVHARDWASPPESKICIETIDYGFSNYIINHTVYGIRPCLIQTIGKGHHDIDVLPDELVVRIYDYEFTLFPSAIYRDANNYTGNIVDKYLLFEWIEVRGQE
jgi:hypothetical protein